MAETPSKRQREETHLAEDSEEDPKRQKSYTQILSLLEGEEVNETNQDFSSIFTTLQRELSFDSTTSDDPFSLLPHPDQENGSSEFSPAPQSGLNGEEEEERERVIRHLLEASDDELGIPHRSSDGGGGGDDEEAAVVVMNGGDELALCDGFWELEDEAANYYALLQSELFM